MSSPFPSVEDTIAKFHRCGDEAVWWKKTGIDPSAAARILWLKTHPLPSAIDAASKLRNEPSLKSSPL
jgi:hypothetical protein